MTKQLYRSHRAFGREVARATDGDNKELVILETADQTMAVSPAHMLMPVSSGEAIFEARVRLAHAVTQARVLGAGSDAILEMVQQALDDTA